MRLPILKRLMDILGAGLLLVVLSPVMLAVALLIRFSLGSPVLFCQLRPGIHGKPFVLRKFRTMTDERDAEGNLLPDEQRLTRLGRFLRRTSLDELPELFNVIKGEMSLVGPRPLLMKYMPFFTERERKRLDMPPGITGLAQVSGRNNVSWDERLELDAQYVERWTLLLDMRILFLTLIKVLRREGVQELPRSTMLDLDVERQRRGGMYAGS